MKLLAIDSNSIVNRAYYGVRPLTTKDGVFTNGIYGFLTIFLKIMEEVSPDAVAFAFDLKAPTFRHEQFDGYKAGRKGMPEELAMQMPYLKDLIAALGYKVVTCSGFEADDILGTFAKSCTEDGNECVIATGDRDSLQLVSDSVTVRLATTKMGKPETVVYTPKEVFEKYGVSPHELIAVKALMGDTSDNIPGVPGIGEKTALDLVVKYHDVAGVYANIDASDIKEGVRKKLLAGKELCDMSLELARIHCAVPIETAANAYVKAEENTELCSSIMTRLELFGLMKRMNIPQGLISQETAPQVKSTQELHPIESNMANAAEILKAEKVYLLSEYSGDNMTKLCICGDGKMLETDSNSEDFAELISLISRCERLYIHGSKLLYRMEMTHGLPVSHVLFDAELAAYLLSPTSPEYSCDRLAAEYAVQPYCVEGSLEGISAMMPSFVPLCKILEDKIAEYNQQGLLKDIEQPLAEVLAGMEIVGFDLDTEGLAAFGKGLDEDLAKLEKSITEMAGESFNLNSTKQLSTILFEKLGLPSGRKTKSGYSTDADVLEGLKGKHPIIDDILSYRQLAKLKSTYVDGLLKVVGEDGRVHTSFKQTETRTGRISSTEPNMQNIPVRSELGSNLRKFFHAEHGKLLADADYSQIELRVLAHIAKDKNMIEAFNSGEDIHTQTASQVFGLPPLFVTPLMRSRAKAVNFGIVYGIGAYSLAKDIGVSMSEADAYIKNYNKTYSGVKAYMDNTKKLAAEQGYVTTLFGRRRDLPELAATNKQTKAFGERVAMNTPIQGTAADIIKIAMIKVYRRLEAEKLTAKLILQVHDELIIETPENEVPAVKALLKEEMESAVKLSVELTADVNVGKTWFDAK